MDQLADEFAPRGVQSLFLYTREAHPAERYGAHDSLPSKLAQAREFQRLCGCRRPILVDDLEGSVHRAFGQMPNMTYILGRGNTVLFRASWTDPHTVRWALDYLLDRDRGRQPGFRLERFYVELQGHRWEDRPGFDAGLAFNGPQAVSDFAEAERRWARGEHLGSLRRRPPG